MLFSFVLLFDSTHYPKRLAGTTTTLMMSFVLKSFPYKDQIEELFIVIVLFYVTISTFSLFSFFHCVILFKGMI